MQIAIHQLEEKKKQVCGKNIYQISICESLLSFMMTTQSLETSHLHHHVKLCFIFEQTQIVKCYYLHFMERQDIICMDDEYLV